VDREVLLQIVDGFAEDREDGRDSGVRLVEACVRVIDVTGAGIMLMVDNEHRGTLAGSDAAIRATEELQFALGEGPCIDTYRGGRPVLEPDLAHPEEVRWPAFSKPAVEAGVGAIFGFPLQIGAIRIGALDLYRDGPGDLSTVQFADALIMAEVITHAVLELQAAAKPGAFASELDVSANRMVVHQASGMTSAQLDLPIGEAMVRLRGYAMANELTLEAVSRAVVERRLRIT
jgi:hypothetical protein